MQFADYSAWQRRWAKSAAFEEQAAYWKAQLAGELEPLNLPRDGDRSAADLACGDECSLEIGRELVSALKARAQERGATLFMVLLAAYKILLHRYTAQTDIIVGVPIANRRHPEVEGLIGPFVNTLALRTAVSSAKTFEELLEDVKETALQVYEQVYEHQDMPFELLIRILQVERDSDRTPVFQTTFVLQDFPEVRSSTGRPEIHPISCQHAYVEIRSDFGGKTDAFQLAGDHAVQHRPLFSRARATNAGTLACRAARRRASPGSTCLRDLVAISE